MHNQIYRKSAVFVSVSHGIVSISDSLINVRRERIFHVIVHQNLQILSEWQHSMIAGSSDTWVVPEYLSFVESRDLTSSSSTLLSFSWAFFRLPTCYALLTEFGLGTPQFMLNALFLYSSCRIITLSKLLESFAELPMLDQCRHYRCPLQQRDR